MTHVTNSIECNVLRFVDAIQVENRWMYEFARQHNPDRDVDIRFLQPGIDTGRFRPKSGRDFHRDPYVLCVGRLNDSRKNVGLLLEAYAKLSIDARRSLRLVLAGLDGPPKAFWKRAGALGLLDRIQFIRSPSNDDLLGLYQGASMFALTSDEEGFGMVILEAMSCGIPVISTRSGGPDDIITDGSEGFLVPVEDTAALADRIARLHFNVELNLRMGHCARLTIQNRYATDVAGKPFVEVWDRLLATKVYR
jgi:glycosyltransferase involved in cell wall biosynthesis